MIIQYYLIVYRCPKIQSFIYRSRIKRVPETYSVVLLTVIGCLNLMCVENLTSVYG